MGYLEKRQPCCSHHLVECWQDKGGGGQVNAAKVQHNKQYVEPIGFLKLGSPPYGGEGLEIYNNLEYTE